MKFKNQIAVGFLVILFSFLGMSVSQAQVTFKPGIRTGANFAHFTEGSIYEYDDGYYDSDFTDFNSKTEFYIGFYGALKLSKFYTLQPEIDYSAQGSKASSRNGAIRKEFNVDYLSIEVMNKFTFGKANVHFGPTLDFVVDKNFNTEAGVDMAFVLGAGFNITPNIGIEGRVKKGIIPVFETIDDYHTNVVFSIGGTYTFDIK